MLCTTAINTCASEIYITKITVSSYVFCRVGKFYRAVFACFFQDDRCETQQCWSVFRICHKSGNILLLNYYRPQGPNVADLHALISNTKIDLRTEFIPCRRHVGPHVDASCFWNVPIHSLHPTSIRCPLNPFG